MPSTKPAPQKILIVDDDLSYLKLAESSLKKRGFSVRSCDSGEGALAQINLELPHLILLDVQMPKLTGDELVKMITQWKPEIRIWMITSNLTPEIEQDCLQNGASVCLKKPVDFDQLARLIRESCN